MTAIRAAALGRGIGSVSGVIVGEPPPAFPFPARRQFERALCAPPLLSAAVAELGLFGDDAKLLPTKGRYE